MSTSPSLHSVVLVPRLWIYLTPLFGRERWARLEREPISLSSSTTRTSSSSHPWSFCSSPSTLTFCEVEVHLPLLVCVNVVLTVLFLGAGDMSIVRMALVSFFELGGHFVELVLAVQNSAYGCRRRRLRRKLGQLSVCRCQSVLWLFSNPSNIYGV